MRGEVGEHTQTRKRNIEMDKRERNAEQYLLADAEVRVCDVTCMVMLLVHEDVSANDGAEGNGGERSHSPTLELLCGQKEQRKKQQQKHAMHKG